MNLAFYYHIPLAVKDGSLYLPGFLGVFVDSLAKEVSSLTLVMHKATSTQSDQADYKLKYKNIKHLNLGTKTPAWHREFFHRIILNKLKSKLVNCDAFIVRCPSSLAPYFYQYLNKKKTKLIFMIVGDYLSSVRLSKPKNIREKVVNRYLIYNSRKFEKSLVSSNILVNSVELYEKHKDKTDNIHQIRTTTLSDEDFFIRKDTCLGTPIHLLFTGRVDLMKGLDELVRATYKLNQGDRDIILNIVGWEEDENKPVKKQLNESANELGIIKKVIFHGKKSIGIELNALYRMADIFVLPSYHEGFPRVIWEAMANSLPVITTKVGGIPNNLSDKDALLIPPKSTEAIVLAVRKVINEDKLRRKLIANGIKLAKNNTLEIQTKKLIEIIDKLNE